MQMRGALEHAWQADKQINEQINSNNIYTT